jgi:uncharacterized protein with HEPN domain
MLDSAREAIMFCDGRARKDLDGDRVLALAPVKAIEIVGEAAATVSLSVRDQYAAIPWQDIIGMRHRLVHGYFAIDMDRVWDTVTDDLPPLVAALESFLDEAADD